MTTVRIGRRQLDVSWSLLDRAIAAVSPAQGLERWRGRVMMAASGVGGYDAGRRERRATKRWRPLDGSADADTLLDLPDLRGRARDLARNVPLAAGALATRKTSVIGCGLRLIAAIDAETLGLAPEQADAAEREQEKEFALFWKSCDLSGEQHGDELAALAYGAQNESGDSFILRRYRARAGEIYGTRLQLLEADRVSNPNRAADTDRLSGGKEFDADGFCDAVHVSNKHPGSLRAGALTWERVPTRDPEGRTLVIHLYDRLRPEQSRGVPWLAPVIELVKQRANYHDSEIAAAVIGAMTTLAIETPNDEDTAPVVGETDSSLESDEVKLGSGAVISLAPGEKANLLNPTRPNAMADPFLLSMAREIAVGLEFPYELLIKHFTASYSASKAALQIAWQGFSKERATFSRKLYQNAYEWMMEEAVASGRLNRPGFFADPRIRMAWCGAEWRGAPVPSLNPYQEAQADDLDMKNGAKTLEQVCAERTGGEAEKKIATRGKEIALMRAQGIAPQPAPAVAAPSPAAAAAPGNVAGSDAEDETQPQGAVA